MREPWLQHYDSGVPRSIDSYPDKTLVDFVLERSRSNPDMTALVFHGRNVSYGELEEASGALATQLLGIGVKPGDRVAILLPNCPQFVIAELAIWRIGAISAPQNALYTQRELEESMKATEPVAMIVLTLFYERVKQCRNTTLTRVIATNIKEYLPPLKRVLFALLKEKKGGHRIALRDQDIWFADAVNDRTAPVADSAARPGDAAVILMSGGTTGTPKGVVSDHRALVMAGTQLAAWLREPISEKGAAVALPLPLSHTYGCAGAQSLAIVHGVPLVLIPNARDIDDLLRTIVRDRPTLFCAVPTLLSAILNHPQVKSGNIRLDSLKACFSGAASLMAETKAQFERVTGCRIVEGYSLTEATMATCCNPYRGTSKIGSIGMPLPDVHVRIVDAEDESELEIGKIGEITLRAPQLMRCYWNNAHETASALRIMRDGSMWLFTGDLGYVDEEGYVFLVDRKKDLIKTSGYQVWPREVEEIIASFPGVLEVGVAGLPDEKRGEIVAAWVVPARGESIDVGLLRAWCRTKLAPYKVPTHIEVRTELPKTMIGKILRRALVAEAKGAKATQPAQASG
jgi:long-chain acyl-CoA synthetase